MQAAVDRDDSETVSQVSETRMSDSAETAQSSGTSGPAILTREEQHWLFAATSLPAEWRETYTATGPESFIASSLTVSQFQAARRLSDEKQLDIFAILAATMYALLYHYLGYGFDRSAAPTFHNLIDREAVEDSATSPSLQQSFRVGIGLASVPDAAHIALILESDARGNVTTGSWRYRNDIFDPATVHRIDGHFSRLLRDVVRDLDSPISQHAVLSPTEQEHLLQDWNATSSAFPRDRSLSSLFEEMVERTPEAIAIVDGDFQLTYRQLNYRANGLTKHLMHRGVEAGQRVGVALERSATMIVSMLAILKAGAAYVPLDTTYPPERIRFMVNDSGVSLVITDSRRRERLPEEQPVICMDSPDLDVDWEDQANPAELATGESVGYVMYTSGSTGPPKGAMLPHRAITRLVRDTNYVALGPSDVCAQISNPLFDAILFEVWGAFLNGGKLVVLPTHIVLSPDSLAEAIRANGITALYLGSSLFNLVAMHRPDAFAGVRYLIVGGDVVSPRWARAVLNSDRPQHLINGYGPTECTTFAVTHDIKDSDVSEDAVSIPIGKPIGNTQAYILDATLQPVPIGVRGHLYLGGDGNALAYLNRPELTTERFIPDTFSQSPGATLYRTGDIARHRGDGVIEFFGREDDQIKIRGFRIELGEIIGVLKSHPQVKDCVITVDDDSINEKRLVAYIAVGDRVAADDQQASAEDFRRFLEQRLPGYMIPAAFIVRRELPLARNGKADRHSLREAEAAPHSETSGAPIEAVSDLRDAVATVWKRVLGANDVGLDQNFFDLGGDSLRLAQVAAQLKPLVLAHFSIVDLFRFPTIRSFTDSLVPHTGKHSAMDEARARALKTRAVLQTLQPTRRLGK